MTPEVQSHPMNGLPKLPREIPHSMEFSRPVQVPAPAPEAKPNSVELAEILSPSQCALRPCGFHRNREGPPAHRCERRIRRIPAELTAMETLKGLVTEWAYQCYVMTGSFLETSKRSKVTYMFRRLRPTVAISARDHDGRGVKILCTLCGHPIAHYDGSWAGALCPSDDVIAALLLMRADEPRLWRMYNQHAAWDAASGL